MLVKRHSNTSQATAATSTPSPKQEDFARISLDHANVDVLPVAVIRQASQSLAGGSLLLVGRMRLGVFGCPFSFSVRVLARFCK